MLKVWDDGTLQPGEAVMEIKEVETGKSEGLSDRLDVVSGWTDLASRITPLLTQLNNDAVIHRDR